MRSSAHVAVAATAGGGVAMVDVRSEPPLTVRRAGGRVLIVGSAAGPVGGDELALDVTVGAGCRLDLGTAAATVVWPGADGAPSSTTTTARVGVAGHLDWRPEPMVSTVGSDHRATTRVELAHGATCALVEEIAMGRTGQDGGRVCLDLRVTRAGRALVHHAEQLGPGPSSSLAALGRARHLVAVVVVGACAGAPTSHVASAGSAAWLPMAEDAAILLALGDDRPCCLSAIARLGALSPTASVASARARLC